MLPFSEAPYFCALGVACPRATTTDGYATTTCTYIIIFACHYFLYTGNAVALDTGNFEAHHLSGCSCSKITQLCAVWKVQLLAIVLLQRYRNTAEKG